MKSASSCPPMKQMKMSCECGEESYDLVAKMDDKEANESAGEWKR
jgi:hypothetical protein